MHDMKAACLYQETRLNLDPALPASTVEVLLPIDGASAFAARLSPKRRRVDCSNLIYDEATFSAQHLASESSVHFRPLVNGAKKGISPRAILWRVLGERKVLELQAVDLTQEQTDKHEPLLTLRFAFPHAIRPSGITFTEKSDAAKSDGFVAFVLTETGEIVTLELDKALFVRRKHLEDVGAGLGDWCKTYSPSVFTYRTPCRMLAKNEAELWASLSDGSLLRLQKEDNGSTWRESLFTEGGWKASMRSLIPWKAQATVRFEDVELAHNTAISIALSPDCRHIWTVNLDHTLKAWNVDTGRVTFVADLAGDLSRDLHKPINSLLDPAKATLIKITPARAEGEYIVVTFSPRTREFKFWAVKDADSADFGVQDMRGEVKLVPPVEQMTDATMWTLESFDLRYHHNPGQNEWELWTLLRFGTKCQPLHVKFNLDDHTDGLTKAWQYNWSCIDPGLNTIEELRQNLHNPGDTPSINTMTSAVGATEQWLEFLFYPGRFTVPTLETALSVYWKSLGSSLQSRKQAVLNSSRPLKERICDTLSLSVGLARGADDAIAFVRFEHDIEFQWQIYYGVVKDLHKRREELLSLAFDAEHNLAWLVMADQISAVRNSSELETLWLNRELFTISETLDPENLLMQALIDAKNSELGQLFNAVALFRGTFSRAFLQNLDSLLRIETTVNTDGAPLDSLQFIYDRSGFAGQVSDEDYNRLTFALDGIGGLISLDDSTFLAAMDLLSETQRGHHHNRQLTRYGARALIRGAQETLDLGSSIIFNLLLLVIFMGGELEDLSPDFDAGSVFASLMGKFKELNLLLWLASNARQETPAPSNDETSEDDSTALVLASNSEDQAVASSTILESVFIGDWSGMLVPSGSQSSLLMYWCRAWAFGARLSEQYEIITSHIMGTLLKGRDISLAYEFMIFLCESPWTLYLKARLCLATSEFTEAAACFESAAAGLATGKYFDIEQFDSANLVDLVERNLFNEGLAAFFQHVTALFEQAGTMSYVAHFASLALNSMEHLDKESAGMRTELLSRLFTASLQTSRFSAACSALKQYTDLALQKSALHTLLKTLLSTSQIPLLLSLPLPCPEEVDVYLSTLASTATTSQSFPSTLTESTTTGPHYHKILYAYRLRRGDLRAAASCLWDRLQGLRALREAKGGFGADEVLEAEIGEGYLALLNVLGLMDREQAWILTRPLPKKKAAFAVPTNLKLGQVVAAHAGKGGGVAGGNGGKEKRMIVTLKDVRKAWQDELDRRADVRAGRFPLLQLGGGEDVEAEGMQVDGVDDGDVFV